MLIAMDGLRQLYKSMREQGIERQRFPYTHGKIVFDVFFFIDDNPFELLFGVHSHNFAFSFKVEKGFRVESQMDNEEYKRLCAILELRFDPNNTFSPANFLKSFNEHIPSIATPNRIPQPHETAAVRRDVHEAEKIYFCGWRNNNLQKDRVSPMNLDKTLKNLGKTVYDLCKRRNISSRWTDIYKDKIDFYLPD